MTEVYISTGAFGATHLGQILSQASVLGIDHIELSTGVAATPGLRETVMAHRHGFRFLVHNYFPPPAAPFLLNLATSREDVGARTMALCRDAVRLCAAVGAPFYSVHCGFTFDSADGSHLGNASQMTLPRISMDEAMHHFIRRLSDLCRFGAAHGIKIAVENNVIAGFGLVDGGNRLCLGTDVESLTTIFEAVGGNDLGLLFDIGHAKVNQQTIGADMHDVLNAFGERLVALHVSDNDGFNDQNLPVATDCPLVGIIARHRVPRIVESYGLDPTVIREQAALMASL